jgi:hypothetical protein
MTTRWRDLPQLPERRVGTVARLLPVVVPVVVAGALWALGRPVLAAVLLVVAVVLLVVAALRPSVGAALTRGAAAFGRAVAGGLSWLLLGLVQLLVVAPVAGLARLTRRDPLVAEGDGTTRWADRAPRRSARRTFGSDVDVRRPAGPVLGTVRAVPRAVGFVVAFALLNYGLGWVWDQEVGSHDDPVLVADPTSTLDRADSDAYADEPWARDYWRAFDDLPLDPVPYLLTRVGDVQGDLISSNDGVRTTADPPTGDPDAVVWLLGGGGAWGEGQRDDHTVASALVARAAEDGVGLRVVNLAQPGYTSWQSALLLEQQLAVRDAPDLVLHYEGVDDAAVQVQLPSDAPSHYNVLGLTRALTGRESAREQVDDLWQEYRDTSVLTRLADRVGSVFGVQPAGAADDDLGDRVLDLRRRARELVAGVVARADVPVVDVWQAATRVPGDDGAYRSLDVPAGDVDLRDVLDDVADTSVVDGTIVDEAGALLVADALWDALAPRLAVPG